MYNKNLDHMFLSRLLLHTNMRVCSKNTPECGTVRCYDGKLYTTFFTKKLYLFKTITYFTYIPANREHGVEDFMPDSAMLLT